MNKIKKGDTVYIIAGKDKGKTGSVLQVLNERLVVGGINTVKKSFKPNPEKGDQGGFREIEKSIHLSNVQLQDPQSGMGSRVGIRLNEDGQRVRYFKRSNELVDVNK